MKDKDKKKKPAAPVRRRRVKVDFPSLPSAIVNKKCVAKLKSKVLFERIAWDEGKQVRIHEGILFNYDPSDGWMCIWDETLNQFFMFMETDPVAIKVLRAEDLLPEAELIVVKEELALYKLHVKILEEKVGKLYLPVRA